LTNYETAHFPLARANACAVRKIVRYDIVVALVHFALVLLLHFQRYWESAIRVACS